MVDLVNCLRDNTASLTILMNLLTNHLLFRHQYASHQLLAFLFCFYSRMDEHPQFPSSLKE